MTIPPAPAPLPPWAKAVLYLAPYAYGTGYQLVDYFLEEDGGADALAWLYVVAKCTRTSPTGTTEDAAQIGFDVVNMTGGAIDTSFTSEDLDKVQDALSVALPALAAEMNDRHKWSELRFYVRRFNESGAGFADMGDPIRVTATPWQGAVGEASGLPYQVAMTVTEKTAFRRHWGRVYVPGIRAADLDVYGRWEQPTCALVADIFSDLYELLTSRDFWPVVASGSTRSLYTVTQLQVDDIPDVQRRRRARTTLIREVRGAA